MKKALKISIGVVLGAAIIGLFVVLLSGVDIAVLNPKGIIADQQKSLIVFTVLLSLVVVVPVFILLFVISWKYREGNTKAKYTPDNDHNTALEIVWWGIPIAIILLLSVITWKTSHELDPYKALESDTKPLTIQVVALQWKWLFIYPEQGIASVNLLPFPEKTPLNFLITSDAPMNSFWIPSLGGQVYAMSGMTTKLHLMADSVGTYKGSSANISGEGFAKMKFDANSLSRDDFDAWVSKAKSSGNMLSDKTYATLAAPSTVDSPSAYTLQSKDLFTNILMKYMTPTSHEMHGTHATEERIDASKSVMEEMR